MSTFLPPVAEYRFKAMCLSDDSAGGVFREEKAVGMAVAPMPVNAAVRNVGSPPQVLTEPPTAERPACVMLDLPAELSAMLVRLAETIDPDHRHEKGVERVSHITVKYGLTCPVEEVKAALADHGPVEYQLGEFRVFHKDDKDVLYVDVLSPALHKLNRTLSALPCNPDDHPRYVPHVTLAYLKSPSRGACPADVYAAAWNGAIQMTAQGTADELTYSGPDKVPCRIPLTTPVPARVAGEEVREKGYNEDIARTIWDAADHDGEHPAAQDVTAEALRMLGASGPQEGTPAHAAREFMTELARKWKADPDGGQAVLDRLRDDPEFREQILAHLNQSTREKGMEGEEPPAQPVKPVKPVKVKKAKGGKVATPAASTTPAEAPAQEVKPTVPADKPAYGQPTATPPEPAADGEAKGGIHPDVMKHIVATHELLASMGSGPLTHDHLKQLTDHLQDTTHAHLDHYVNAHGIPARSGTKAVKASRIAQRMIGSRIPAVPYGLKEIPHESSATPATSGLDHVLGHVMDNPHVARQVAKHVQDHPHEADRLAGEMAAERPATPTPTSDTPADHPAVQAVADHVDSHAVHIHTPGETPVRVTHVEQTPAGMVVHDEAGGRHTGDELHAAGAVITASPHPDETREIPSQRITPPDSTEPAHPVQRVRPGSAPVKIPGSEGMDDDGDGEGESDESRTFPSKGGSQAGTTPPGGGTPASTQPVPARTTTAGQTPPSPTGGTPSAPAVGDQKAPKGHHRFYLDNGVPIDVPVKSGSDPADVAKQVANSPSFGRKMTVTHAVDENGTHVFGPQAGKAGGAAAGTGAGDNPHGHTPSQKKWAATLAASGHGTMGRVDADGRVHVTSSAGDEYVLDRKQLAHATRTGEYPQRDRQNWPEWATAAHKQLQGIGASIEDVLPGSQVKVKAKDGTAYTMRRGDLAQSIGAGKIIPPAGHTQNAEYEELARQFDQKGLGKLDGHLKSAGLYRVVKDGKVHHLRKWDMQKALQSGQMPGDPVIPKAEAAGVRAVLAKHPHMGRLNAVLPPDEKGGPTRYHLMAEDGTHHYPTAADLAHMNTHGEMPDSHGFEEAGLGKVRERHKDGSVVVEEPNGNTRLLTAGELNGAVTAGKLPPVAKAVAAGGGPTATGFAERFVMDAADRKGVDPVAAEEEHKWLLDATKKYAARYGDTEDTARRMARAVGDMRGELGTHASRYDEALGRAFADHPVNTGGVPTKEKDVKVALAKRGLGKLVRATDDGKHLVTGPDGRARLLTLAEVHDALRTGQHKPARTLTAGQPATGQADDDIPTVHPLTPIQRVGAQGPPAGHQYPQAANATPTVAKPLPVAKRVDDDGQDGEGEEPRGLFGKAERALDRDILPAGVQGVLDRVGDAGKKVAGKVDGWFDRTFGGKGKAKPAQPTSPQLAAPPTPLPPQSQAKVDKVGQKLAAVYKGNPAAMAALERNAGWARTMAKMHAHKVAHRFGGDVKMAEAKLYHLIRHLAHAAHTRGVGGVGAGKLGGVGLKVRRLKGLGFDPDAFIDGRDPFSALAAMFA